MLISLLIYNDGIIYISQNQHEINLDNHKQRHNPKDCKDGKGNGGGGSKTRRDKGNDGGGTNSTEKH